METSPFGPYHIETRRAMHRPDQLWVSIDLVPHAECLKRESLVDEITEHIRSSLEPYGLKSLVFAAYPIVLLVWRDSKAGDKDHLDSLTAKDIEMLVQILESMSSISVGYIREERTQERFGHNTREANWKLIDNKLVRIPIPNL
jgi:hypothetical protein